MSPAHSWMDSVTDLPADLYDCLLSLFPSGVILNHGALESMPMCLFLRWNDSAYTLPGRAPSAPLLDCGVIRKTVPSGPEAL